MTELYTDVWGVRMGPMGCPWSGESVRSQLAELAPKVRVVSMALPDHFIEHGPVPTLRDDAGLSVRSVVDRVESFVKRR